MQTGAETQRVCLKVNSKVSAVQRGPGPFLGTGLGLQDGSGSAVTSDTLGFPSSLHSAAEQEVLEHGFLTPNNVSISFQTEQIIHQ